MNQCEKCGMEIQEGTVSCPRCGTTINNLGVIRTQEDSGMFCKYCGKRIETSASFCSYCGSAQMSNDGETNIAVSKVTSSGMNTLKSIGVGLTLLGVFAGIFIIIFMATSGTAFGYDSWNYYYGGGREMSIGIAIFCVFSLLIGIFMLIGSKKR